MRKILSIIFIILPMNGCQKVQTFEVVGTWVMKEESRKLLPSDIENSLVKITVLGDGTFIAYELPRIGYFYSGKYVDKWRVISGSGTWKFLDISGSQNLHLWFHEFSFENEEKKNVSEGFPLVISKVWSTIDMYYDLSDPDQFMRVEFEKILH